MNYTMTFTPDQAAMLWQCIQSAALPRAATDDLAVAFRTQIEQQNREREAQARAQSNGHDEQSTQQ